MKKLIKQLFVLIHHDQRDILGFIGSTGGQIDKLKMTSKPDLSIVLYTYSFVLSLGAIFSQTQNMYQFIWGCWLPSDPFPV